MCLVFGEVPLVETAVAGNVPIVGSLRSPVPAIPGGIRLPAPLAERQAENQGVNVNVTVENSKDLPNIVGDEAYKVIEQEMQPGGLLDNRN